MAPCKRSAAVTRVIPEASDTHSTARTSMPEQQHCCWALTFRWHPVFVRAARKAPVVRVQARHVTRAVAARRRTPALLLVHTWSVCEGKDVEVISTQAAADCTLQLLSGLLQGCFAWFTLQNNPPVVHPLFETSYLAPPSLTRLSSDWLPL